MKKIAHFNWGNDANWKKMMLAMKMFTFLLLMALQVSAKNYGQETISLHSKNISLINAIKSIEKQSSYRFFFSDDIVPANKEVSISVKNATLDEVMRKMLDGLALTWKVLDKKLVIISTLDKKEYIIPQRTLTGRVLSPDGQPLQGASIQIKGTTRGTTTDANGNFRLAVSETDKTLVISYTGYTTQEYIIGKEESVTFNLVIAPKSLDEVVVVGYGSQRKRDLTGAVSVVNAADIANRPIIDAGEALQGKAAGVQVVSNSGKPGAGLSIRIRGSSSISAGNDPLYVVDGIPLTDLSAFNPNDIETISVLKDAASASIYGTRAANGVVVITTKKGVVGKSKIDFSTYLGTSSTTKKLDVLNAKQYQEYVNELKKSTTAVTDAMVQANNINWPDEVFQNGSQQNYQLSVSGATEKTQHYISVNYTDQKGIIKPATFNRVNGRINLTTKANNWLTLITSTTVSRTKNNDVTDNASVSRGGVVLAALETPSIIPKYNSLASNALFNLDQTGAPIGSIGFNPIGNNWENPYGAIYGRYTKNINDRLLSNIGADIKIARGLTIQSRFGIDYSNDKSTFFLDPFLTVYGRQTHGQQNQTKTNNLTWLSEQTINYTANWGKSHFSALAGWTAQDSHTEQTYISGSFLKQEYRLLPWEQSFLRDSIHTPATTSIDDWALISYLGRITYDFDGKYLFQANIRSDQSSKFAPGNRTATFPSLSAGWRISREDFMKDVKVFNDLKLRVGWGQNGNQEGMGSYGYLPLSTIDPVTGGVVSSTIAPQSLTWETSTQTNIGIDATFLNNRITFSGDFYIKKTKDVLINLPLPAQAGYPTAPVNASAMKNTGEEFLISSRNINTRNFRWNTDFNISFNQNKVETIASGISFLNMWGAVDSRTNAIALVKGYGLGEFYGYVAKGVDPATGQQLYLTKDGSLTNNPAPPDRILLGNAQPKFVYGFTNSFSYKNFDLLVFIQGSQGNKIFNAGRLESEAMIFGINQSTAILNRWKKAGDITDIPAVAENGSFNNSLTSSRFLESGSYLRFKTITLSYKIDPKLLSGIGLSAASIYVSCNNLFTITKYKGFDPEVSSNGNATNSSTSGGSISGTPNTDSRNISLGLDNGAYPQAKMFLFGINISLK